CPSIVLAGAVEATPATATAAISVGNAIFMDHLLCGPFHVLRGITAQVAPFRQCAANSSWPRMSPCQPVHQRCARRRCGSRPLRESIGPAAIGQTEKDGHAATLPVNLQQR